MNTRETHLQIFYRIISKKEKIITRKVCLAKMKKKYLTSGLKSTCK